MNTTVTPAAVAKRARSIFKAWAHDAPADMRGWKTMTVAELHSVCDPNAAFDSAATDVYGPSIDDQWDTYLAVLNEAMRLYDEKVAR